MSSQPDVPKRVSQAVVEQFVRFIVNDDLKAGGRLPTERDLAARFRVSRPSLREALRVLEAIGHVEIRPGGGTFLSDLNITPFLSVIAPQFVRRKGYEAEFLELRIMLKLKAAEMAARSGRTDGVPRSSTSNIRPSTKRYGTEMRLRQNQEWKVICGTLWGFISPDTQPTPVPFPSKENVCYIVTGSR